jgi:hypothetical protein
MRCVALPRFAYTQVQKNWWGLPKRGDFHTEAINMHPSDDRVYETASRTDIVLIRADGAVMNDRGG